MVVGSVNIISWAAPGLRKVVHGCVFIVRMGVLLGGGFDAKLVVCVDEFW